MNSARTNSSSGRPALPGAGTGSAPASSPSPSLEPAGVDDDEHHHHLSQAAHDSTIAAAAAAAAVAAHHDSISTPGHNPTAASLGLTAQHDNGSVTPQPQHQQQQQVQQVQHQQQQQSPNVNNLSVNSVFTQSAVSAAAAAAVAAQQAAALGASTQRKSTKATWTSSDDLELIRQLRVQRESHDIAAKANGGTPSILGNRGITWSAVEAGMEKYRIEKGSSEGRYDSLACRNRWQLLLLQYRVVADIRCQPGFIWSDAEGARMVPSHMWDAWVNSLDTAHKIRIAKIFRLKGFPLFNEVAALAGDPAFLTSNSSGSASASGSHHNPHSGGYGQQQGNQGKVSTPAANRARALLNNGNNSQYNSPASGNHWSVNKRRNTGNHSHDLSQDASFGLGDPSYGNPAGSSSMAAAAAAASLDPNEQLIQQAQRRVRNEASGLSITQKVTLTNLFRQDLTAVWTYMAIGDNEDEFRLAWLKEEVERVNSRKAAEGGAVGGAGASGGMVPPPPAPGVSVSGGEV